MAQLPELRLEYQMFGTVTLPFFAIDEQSMPSRHTFRQDHRERRLRPSRQVLSDGSHHRDIPPIYQGLHLSDLHPICTLPGRLPTWSTDGTQLGVISVGSTRRLLTWSSDNFGVWFVMPDTCNAKTMRRLAKSFTVTDGQTIVDFAYSVLYPEYVVVTAEEGPHICSYLLRKDGLEQPAPDVNNAVRVGPDGLTEHERAMSGGVGQGQVWLVGEATAETSGWWVHCPPWPLGSAVQHRTTTRTQRGGYDQTRQAGPDCRPQPGRPSPKPHTPVGPSLHSHGRRGPDQPLLLLGLGS
ncbi:hypothetical protein J8273_2449 [Carpediemonas membranifera]|uniref:Uncharacterized protein n=1 Tax=Carpediemonas membranifera TaxID=201153 RepID=A0A8J6E5P8_9EUKA|nr:hypothetical protein J8273_2449 [Carpediemonas membranifera]|eukprot:KAG9396097.1 hypothetical protein J8273_2449 [Carpediemonas membranifera]